MSEISKSRKIWMSFVKSCTASPWSQLLMFLRLHVALFNLESRIDFLVFVVLPTRARSEHVPVIWVFEWCTVPEHSYYPQLLMIRYSDQPFQPSTMNSCSNLVSPTSLGLEKPDIYSSIFQRVVYFREFHVCELEMVWNWRIVLIICPCQRYQYPVIPSLGSEEARSG